MAYGTAEEAQADPALITTTVTSISNVITVNAVIISTSFCNTIIITIITTTVTIAMCIIPIIIVTTVFTNMITLFEEAKVDPAL